MIKMKKEGKRDFISAILVIGWASYLFFGIDLFNHSLTIANVLGVIILILLIFFSYKHFKNYLL